MEPTNIIKLDRATRMLAEVRTIDDAVDLMDLAEAARVYARQVKLGLEAQNHAAEIKLRAQRRAGEILDGMEKAKPRGSNQYQEAFPKESDPPTYDELGISHKDAHVWQTIAAVPEEKFEEVIEQAKNGGREITTAGVYREAKDELRRDKRNSRREELIRAGQQQHKDTEEYRLICGDLTDELPKIATGSVDVIITDPPYPREYLPFYEVLAKEAARVLRPGGSMVVMVGQSYLPDVLNLIGKHLNYQWTLAYLTPGGQSPQIWQRKVNTFWKPLLWFVNGDYEGNWIGDVCKSEVNNNDKRFHDWGQSESGMADIIERFTAQGETILDPFCGGGTTGVVALKLGRRFIGIDKDQASIEITAGRISQ